MLYLYLNLDLVFFPLITSVVAQLSWQQGAMGRVFSFSLLFLSLQILVRGEGEEVRVETKSGIVGGAIKEYQGQESNGTYYSFKGIPYARPPTGGRAWRDPDPVTPWTRMVCQFNHLYQ